jgi:hypothetical protein
VVAIVVGIPVILLPVGLVWFINASGIYTVMRESYFRRVGRRKRAAAARARE